ncbi:MAG: hypothetical protein HZA34_02405 [Candidatus Pacebacteria bacterium]|nr:hypothetical protein [Candidatus Paceibacterota bacterium]
MRNIVHFIQKHEGIVFILIAMFLLRVPNLYEPYWYGDEGIYLTLGTALRHGLILYRDIIDHKTPLIYVFAMLPSQFWFKFFFMVWMAGATTLFYVLAQRIFKSRWRAIVTSTVFMLLTTLPAFEGNIANGELFVVGFVLAGMVMFSNSSLFMAFLQKKTTYHHEYVLMIFSGICFSLGTLTKVPAVFDIAGVVAIFGFLMCYTFSWKNMRTLLLSGIALCIGFAIPILISVAYFAFHQALSDYAQFGLLYNFRYSTSFRVPVSQDWLAFLYTMPGKALVVAFLGGTTLLLKKYLRPVFQFSFAWYVFTLFSSLLSSRPYPHYFLQLFAPFSLLLGCILYKGRVIEKILFGIGVFLCIFTMIVLNAGLYPTLSYYQTFGQYVTGSLSKDTYRNQFNPLMADTYLVAQYIQTTTTSDDRMFIWGTNPMLYALAKRVPSGRFTVSFHIKDFQANPETFEAIQKTKPPIIVVMNDEDGSFPEFYAYLQQYYIPVQSHLTMKVFRRVMLP